MTDRILIVDDDKMILLGIMALRKRLGLEIDSASGGRQALEAIRSSGPYQAVVSDRNMPGMDGLEFLKRCRAQAPDTVRLMLSGTPHDALSEQALREELLFRFIAKPCTPHQLARHLDAAVQEHHRRASISC